MNNNSARIKQYSKVSTSLACLSNRKLKHILADSKPMHEGIGGKSALISLILRTWKIEDADPYFQINQDPKKKNHPISAYLQKTVLRS